MLAKVRSYAALLLLIVCLACGGSGGSIQSIPLNATVVASGFDQPMLYLASPSNSTLAYVIERPGRVRLLINDVLQGSNVLDISSTVVTDGECGLLGMAFDPNFATNGYVYLHYNAGSPVETRIVRYTMNGGGNSLGSPQPIFSFVQPGTTNHKGGAINFGSDGMLYIMPGDGGGGNDPDNNAQTPTNYLGKILRIDVNSDDFTSDSEQNYHVPTDNPWFGNAGVKPEIWGFGLRNPFRWTVDSVTGGLLIADVGQDAYEEINFEPAGTGHRNYGWNMREGLHASGNSGPAFFTPLKDPFLEYSHGFGESVIGGFIYRGTALGTNVQGRYFFADYVTGRLASVPFTTASGEANAVGTSSIYDHTFGINAALGGDSLSGPVSITPDKNGEIMIVDLNRGNLIRVTP